MGKMFRGLLGVCLIGLGMSFGSIYAENTPVEPKTQTTEVVRLRLRQVKGFS